MYKFINIEQFNYLFMREMIFSYVKVFKSINHHLIIEHSATESSDDIFELGSNLTPVDWVLFFDSTLIFPNMSLYIFLIIKERQEKLTDWVHVNATRKQPMVSWQTDSHPKNAILVNKKSVQVLVSSEYVTKA